MTTNFFGSCEAREAFIERYSHLHTSLVNELLGLLEDVHSHRKPIHQARTEAITRARAVLDEHVVIPRNEAKRQKAIADAAAQRDREAAELRNAAESQPDQPERITAAAKLWVSLRRAVNEWS